VANLSETVVQFPHEVMALLYKGNEQRHVASTRMNDRSSRSHTVFRIVVESRDSSDDPAGEDEVGGYDPVKVGHLNLVDLAGSERVSNTGAEGQRLKEGASINKSLLSLGQVISKLSEGYVNMNGREQLSACN
jgi:centromeric protein E